MLYVCQRGKAIGVVKSSNSTMKSLLQIRLSCIKFFLVFETLSAVMCFVSFLVDFFQVNI